jgi:hypothetical protein
MNKILSGFIIILLAILAGYNFKSDPHTESAVKNGFLNDYRIYSVPLPDSLTLVDELVPINESDIKERIDRELLVNTYWQSNTLLMIKRANKYFPVIEPILKKHGIPDDFKYLAVAESGLQNVTSPAGAKGFWQIMKKTGKELGLEINKDIDERYHLEKATEAACIYLKKAKEKLGSWTLAAASYNAGMNKITSELEKQKVNSYYDLYLGQETSRYIPRIIIIKEILENPDKFGFILSRSDLYKPIKFRTIEIDSSISDLAEFAKKIGTNYKQLKLLNPWLINRQLENKSGKKYQIKITDY